MRRGEGGGGRRGKGGRWVGVYVNVCLRRGMKRKRERKRKKKRARWRSSLGRREGEGGTIGKEVVDELEIIELMMIVK